MSTKSHSEAESQVSSQVFLIYCARIGDLTNLGLGKETGTALISVFGVI